MNKEYFENLAKYNIWAYDKVFGWLNQISDNQLNTKLIGSLEGIAELRYISLVLKKFGFRD